MSKRLEAIKDHIVAAIDLLAMEMDIDPEKRFGALGNVQENLALDLTELQKMTN